MADLTGLDDLFDSGAKPQAGQGGGQSNVGSQPQAAPLEALDDIFNPAAASPAAAAPGSLDDLFAPEQQPGIPLQGLPEPAPVATPEIGPERPGYLEAFTSAVERGVGSFRQVVPAARGMLAENAGDEAAKQAAIAEIQQVEQSLPKPVVGTLQEIHNSDDLAYWLVEKFGEQTPVLLSMVATGGAGGLIGNLAGRGLLLNATQRAALTKAGQIGGAYASNVALETSGTATEQVQATGQFNPELSVGAGLVKGALETYTPFKFLKELPTQGIIGGALRTAGREAITEGLQEQTDILARAYSDPNYHYFSKPMVWRTAEAMAAGGVVGGGVGLGGGVVGKLAGVKQDRGEDRELSPEEIARAPEPPEEPKPGPRFDGPLSWLRRTFQSRSEGEPDFGPRTPEAIDDVIEQKVSTASLAREWAQAGARQREAEAVADFEDDNIPRYVILDAGGNSDGKVYTDTGLEAQLARRPNEPFAPRIVELDQDSLQPGAITAELEDLPETTSNRIFFLPGTKPREKIALLQQYQQMMRGLRGDLDLFFGTETAETAARRQVFVAQYQALLDKGLRVIPSRGANFHYNGSFDGKQIDALPESGRSTAVAWVDDPSKIGAGTQFRIAPLSVEREGKYPVALDFNKLKPEMLEDTFGNPVKNVRDMSPFSFRLKKGVKLPSGAIIRGIGQPGALDRMAGINAQDYAVGNTTGNVRKFVLAEQSLPENWDKQQDAIYRIAQEFMQAMQPIFARLGVKNPPDIVVDASNVYIGPFINVPENYINLPVNPRYWQEAMPAKDLRTDVALALLHEIGHGITLRSWHLLPSALHQQAQMGYERALLKWRTQGQTEHIGWSMGSFTTTGKQIGYNLKFREYLAEQFRRWAISDSQILTELDRFYHGTGQKIRQLYQEAVASIGPERAQSLVQANFSFNQVMEYLESAVAGGQRPVQMMGKAWNIDPSYPWPMELSAARQAVETELERLKQLLTGDMTVRLDPNANAQDLGGGRQWVRTGEMDPNTRTLRIMVGSLAMLGEKNQASRVIAHEAFHGVQDVLTDQEWQLLLRTAQKEQVLSPSDLRNVVNDTKRWMEDNGWSPETNPEWDAIIRYVVETEQMAVLIENRLNGKQYSSEVARILDLLIEAIQRIVNSLKGLGYRSSEDVIRAYYRGEIARRYDLAQEAQVREAMHERLMPAQGSARDWVIGKYKDFRFPETQEEKDRRAGWSRALELGMRVDQPRFPDVEFNKMYPGVIAGERNFAEVNDPTAYAAAVRKQAEEKKTKNKDRFRRALVPPLRPVQGSSQVVETPSRPLVNPTMQQLDEQNIVEFEEVAGPDGKPRLGTYVLRAPDGTVKGWVDTSRDSVKGTAIDMVWVARAFYREQVPMKLYQFVKSRIGEDPKPNGVLTMAGYRALQRINPALVANYQWNESYRFWYSPGEIANIIKSFQSMLKRPNLRAQTRADYQHSLNLFVNLWAKIPPSVLARVKPTQYMAREMRVQETAAVDRQEASELLQAVDGTPASRDPIERIMDQTAAREQAEAAKRLQLPEKMAAASQPEGEIMRAVLDWAKRGEKNPEVNRMLDGISAEGDRISWFSKVFFGLHQLLWRNEHLPQTRRYLSLVEEWNTRIMQWISRADSTTRSWDKLPERQRNELTEFFFWMTEMDYLSAAERAANVVRWPTGAEIAAEVQRRRLTPETMQVFTRASQDFADYLAEIERVSVQKAQQTFAQNPVGLQAELANIAADMAALRAKPYFPMTRFGQYTVTARDPQTREVQGFYAYSTIRERDAAVAQVSRAHPGMTLSVGIVPEEVMEFMGLPAPLLRMIKAQLPGITQNQLAWFDQFGAMMAPERSFRKRWLQRKGTPGYSLDGIRVFAQYFRSGSRYLARIEYKDALQGEINSLQQTVGGLRDSTRRTMLVDYMQRHLNYIMEGGRDWGKLKSLISVFQLGGSVAAAGMNLTQVPLATYPYLAGLFGDRATAKALQRNANVLRQTFGQPPVGSSPDYIAAREEAIAQGKIETGQAIELGSFAEYDNLNRSFAGTARQRAWRQLAYWSMILFSRSEQFNREWTFKTAYELALSQPNAKHVKDVSTLYAVEILDIMARRQLTSEQATAFMVARRTIDQTQLIFQPWARPTFLRSGFASTLQIFFSYTQGMLYLLGNSPGAARMWLGLLFMYGVAGLPGSEDIDRLVRLLSRKFFGKDFSIEHETREMVREITRGTAFDQVGPDLVLHGISRYSFGAGLLPEGWGVPRFDASGSGSMGQVIPGLSEGLRAAANNANWKDFTADVARDVAGAGFGTMFSLMQFLTSDPWSADVKKWEKVLPRSIKAMVRAARYAAEGQERTVQGGPFANFDMRDPDDVATIVTQALGFTPTKVTSKWEMLRATQDIAQWYQTRKLTLYSQLDVAIQNGEVADQQEIVKAMVAYNKELADKGLGAMSIQVRAVVSSLKQKARVRGMQGADLPAQKNLIPLSQQMLDLYPGTRLIEQKKVK
jgi:hypothetical protein